MTQEKLATFKIDEVVWERFKTEAREHGSNASAVLKAFIFRYLKGDASSSELGSEGTEQGIENNLVERIDELERTFQEEIRSIDSRLGELNAG